MPRVAKARKFSGEISGSSPLAEVVTRSTGTDKGFRPSLLEGIFLDPVGQGLAGRADCTTMPARVFALQILRRGPCFRSA